MAICVTIGSTVFSIPDQGECAAWGENLTDAVEALACELATVVGPRDISKTQVCLSNSQCSFANIGSGSSLFKFTNSAVRSFVATYTVRRVGSCCTIIESGNMIGGNQGCCVWVFSYDATGCAGMDFQITTAGQVQYKTTTLAGQSSAKIDFSAKAFEI